jgi:hypothetical protein
MFSSRCVSDDVPGMRRTCSSLRSSHARAIWAAVAECFAATAEMVGSRASGLGPPVEGEPIGKKGT